MMFYRKLYERQFGERPDFFTLFAPPEALRKMDDLMGEAIKRGKPLTDAECHAVYNPVTRDLEEV